MARAAAALRRLHGAEWDDPYAWLRDRDAAEVRAHLEAENAHTEAALEPLAGLRRELYQEMVTRLPGDDATVPVAVDGYLYYERLTAGSDHPVYCRRRGGAGTEAAGDEEVLLDLEALARDRPFLALGAFAASPDHRLLAYALDSAGGERFTLHLRDLTRGAALPETIGDTAPSLVWANDGASFFYVTLDSQHRPYAVRRHRLGDDPAADELVYQEDDARYFVSLFQTRSRRFLGILVESKVTSEIHLAEDRPRGPGLLADGPPAPFRCWLPRRPGVELRLDHRGDHLFLVTNDGACDFRVLAAPVADAAAGAAAWREVVAERPGTAIEAIDCLRDHLVLALRRAGDRVLEVHALGDGPEPVARHEIAVGEPVSTARVADSPTFDTATLRFEYSSLVTPPTTVDYDLATRRRAVRKVAPVPGYEPSRYRCERRWATSPDGTRVPVSLVYRDDRGDRVEGRPRPTLLYAYGAYGISVEPRFSPARVSLLDRGVVYAIAHARGGGECGRRWYQAGKLAAKESTFDDVVAVARELLASGVAAPGRLALRGGSAGGMTVGAVLARSGELFRAALAEVPFVDVLNTMLDPSIPLTVTEYDEWGDPATDPEAFARIRAYSPYENVRGDGLPHLLVTAGLHDPRVQYWEPAKWVARLRAARRATGILGEEPSLLLRVDMESGHRGASGRYRALADEALKLAFLLDALDVVPRVCGER